MSASGKCRSLAGWTLSALLFGLLAPLTQAADQQVPLASAWNDEEGFDCRVLKDREAPQGASQWFERSMWANHCFIFQARAVRISNDGVRTLALSHDVQDGIEREVARFLDGPALILERRGRIGRGGWANVQSDTPASPTAIMSHLEEFYRLRIDGEERVAGRNAVRLDIEPLDAMRYGHRLWLDHATALPLKQVLLDSSGRELETFQVTELQRPRLYDGQVQLDELREPPPDPWRAGWLPPGYVPQPVATRSSVHDDAVGHRLFSDGLSTLSVFVEPLDGDGPALAPGMHRLGISYAAVRHLELGGQPMQLVAMGELPPQVLLRIVEQIVWLPQEGPNEAAQGASG
ncbi:MULTISPECIES: MucB/RseB C-terminal domain-containing protein [Halomonadaceae]|uniref:MucB/RseB C-terminal domain-containing protein n=1 Tax=Halomonadaceae TaxID=28256 RepID=UPI001597ED92|nr:MULTISPECIES: MucB/RseB C-terminal domain-containing protein [Halomonas]QJQ94726.1 negative regulator for alginate biosynthesis MucB [Halomonas sp. PA5]